MKRFWEATRPYSFTASLVPVLIGTTSASRFHLGWLVLTLVGAVAAQIVANVVNDLFDHRTGLDTAENSGAMNAIVRGVVTPEEAWRIVAVAATVALLCGGLAYWRVGPPLLPWLLGGALVAYFYTAPPIALKRRAMGDVAVAFGFGAGYAVGAAMIALGGDLNSPTAVRIVRWGLPALLLVVGILHANNHRDRDSDRRAKAITLANMIPLSGSRGILLGLLVIPYLVMAVSVAQRIWWAALPLLTLPLVLPLLRRALKDDVGGMYVADVAKLHGLFGILTAIGLALTLR